MTETVFALVSSWGPWVIFASAFLSCLALPIPTSLMMLTGGAFVASGDLALWEVVAAAWTGAVLGDQAGYLIGRFGGSALLRRYGGLVKLTPERLEKLEALFQRRGAWIVVTARFVVVLRQLNGLVAGSVLMPFHSFLAANIVGAAAWTGCWTFGPYYLGSFFGLK